MTAKLAEKQNPSPSTFNETGYGNQIIIEFSQTGFRTLRYVVLGWRDHLTKRNQLPIKWHQRQWQQLPEHPLRADIINDLYNTLGDLGIDHLRMRKTNKSKARPELRFGCEAYQILIDAYDSLELVEGKNAPDIVWTASDNWYFGLEILPLTSKKIHAHTKLQRKVGPIGDEALAWFGYSSDSRREVWIYCGTSGKAKRLQPSFSKESGKTKLLQR